MEITQSEAAKLSGVFAPANSSDQGDLRPEQFRDSHRRENKNSEKHTTKQRRVRDHAKSTHYEERR
jgi:hypothetical protein